MDRGIARRLPSGVGQLLVVEDVQAEADDREQQDEEEREDQGELDERLSTMARSQSHHELPHSSMPREK